MKKTLILAPVLCMAVLVWYCVKRSHDTQHYSLALAALAGDGATIGVIVSELRKDRDVPIDPGEFLKRYRTAFTTRWTITTKPSGDLEISHTNYVTWLIGRGGGIVRLISCSYPDAPDAVSLFSGVDFSMPLSGSNTPSVTAELAPDIRRDSDFIWGSYPGYSRTND